MALTTYNRVAPRVAQSRTPRTRPLCLHGMLQGELYLMFICQMECFLQKDQAVNAMLRINRSLLQESYETYKYHGHNAELTNSKSGGL